MSARRKKKTSKNREMYSQVKGILLLALSIFCYFVLTEPDRTGGIGIYVDNFLRLLAGDTAFIIVLIIALVAVKLILPLDRLKSRSRFGGLIAILILYSTWVHLQLLNSRIIDLSGLELFSESIQIGLDRAGGGFIGSFLAGLFLYLFGYTGTYILTLTLALICIVVTLNLNLKRIFSILFQACRQVFKAIKHSALSIATFFKSLFSNGEGRHARHELLDDDEIFFEDAVVDDTHHYSFYGESGDSAAMKDNAAESSYHNVDNLPSMKKPPDTYKDEEMMVKGFNKASSNFTADYQHPPLDLLTKPRLTGEEAQLKNIKNMAKLLENTLLSFGVKARVLHVQSGPTVTRFEVQPEAGVKVSKIINLSDDLALNLAAPLVRIEAPIPGKAALGIEVPNKVIALVHLREVIEDSAFQKSASPLTVGLGKDITGIPVITDLSKMPHLLIAGSTGSGKSVCLNTIITSILYKADPAQVRFLMIDPKVVELSNYNGIPHLLMPVLTDPRKSALALKNMVREMSRRYDLFAAMGLRDINAYNDLRINNSEIEPLPYIVIVIDELADLMIVSPAEVEDSIARLAQMSRAAGIHLLVATQRPSVDVLTGIIKANITSRVAFTVSSQVDSRTILDMAGAEKLLGSGDMLFYPVGAVKPFRVQGAFVSEEELNRITNFLKTQGGSEDLNGINFLEPSEHPEEESDSLFYEAADLVVRTGQASISLLQRRYRIGYTRAARLIDDLERRGIVGPFEGSKPRAVLITVEQAAKLLDEKK